MGFPWTFLAVVMYPLWAFKRWLLFRRRAYVTGSTEHHWFDEVDPSLMVGGALFPGDLEALRARGVGAILNLCAEYLDDEAACEKAQVAAKRVVVYDDFWIGAGAFEESVSWIDARVAEGKKVYVHCAAGRGRSVSIVLAWLVLRRQLDVAAALARVQAVRKAANPTPWQILAVRRYTARKRAAARPV